MSAGRAAVLGGVVVVLAAALAALAAPAGAVHDGPVVGQQDVPADTISLRIGLQENGDANWQVTYRVELDDPNATEAFESLQSDIESDPEPYVDRFASRMRRAMWTAENATGREMSIANASVTARTKSLPQGEYGVVVYRLDWANFAVVEGDTIRAGDAIDEFFLDSRTSLTIAWPEEYGLVSADPSADSVDEGAITWQGRLDFGPDEPRVEVVQGATGGETPGAGGVPFLPMVLVVLVVLVTGGWLYYRRGGSPRSEGGEQGAQGPAAAGEAATEAGPPPELLSNEERVLRLLEQHGGRIKQQQVAEELDWTDAKTSQVVSELREADELESFRLGRENVLTLPDVSIEGEVDGAGDPDAEEGGGKQ